MVKEMAERKWMDSILLPRMQIDDFSIEYDSIAAKVVKEWLLENEYEVYTYLDILIGFFGDNLEDLEEYKKAIKRLSKDAKIGSFRYYAYFGIVPDFIVRKNRKVFFVDAIVNQAKPKKYSAASYKIAEEHGFKTMFIKLDVGIKVGEINRTEI